MDKEKLATKAMQLAQEMLQEILVGQNVAKVRSYFGQQGGSWIGLSQNAFVPDSSAFARAYHHKFPRPLPADAFKQAQWQQFYVDEQLCIIYCQLDVPATDGGDPDCLRSIFTLVAEGDDVRVLNLHCSHAWKLMQDAELFPHQYATLLFEQLEAQEPGSIAAFVTANAPNGMKVCKIEQHYPAIYVNKTLCSLAGYSSMTEMLQATHGRLDKMVYSQDLAKVTQTMICHQNGTPYSVSYRLLHKRGTIVWVLERGQCVVGEVTGNEFYVCTIVPLELNQNDFSYGTLVDRAEIIRHKIPLELFLKLALDIVSSNHPQNAIDKLLQLTCEVLQCSGMAVYDLHSHEDKLLVAYQYVSAGTNPIPKVQGFTRAEVLSLFDATGCSKSSDTSCLPGHYRHSAKVNDMTTILSYLINIKDVPCYFVSAYHCNRQHTWSDNEQEIMQQLAKMLGFLLSNCK